jgi:hypothetical protein
VKNLLQTYVHLIVSVAAGFSQRRTGETPVPPKELAEEYSIGRDSGSIL